VVKGCAVVAVFSLGVTACSSTESYQALRGAEPCASAGNLDAAKSGCPGGRNVLMAMASGHRVTPEEVVEREVLEEQRGGFIVAGGMRIDFGFRFETIVNGIPQLTSVLSYNDILANRGSIPNVNSIVLGGGDLGTTRIIHSAGGANGIGATIITDQSDIDIHSISTLAIDIVNLSNVHNGGPNIGRGGRPLPLELHQSVINSLQ
jgi:hypothetical protein